MSQREAYQILKAKKRWMAPVEVAVELKEKNIHTISNNLMRLFRSGFVSRRISFKPELGRAGWEYNWRKSV